MATKMSKTHNVTFSIRAYEKATSVIQLDDEIIIGYPDGSSTTIYATFGTKRTDSIMKALELFVEKNKDVKVVKTIETPQAEEESNEADASDEESETKEEVKLEDLTKDTFNKTELLEFAKAFTTDEEFSEISPKSKKDIVEYLKTKGGN